MKKVIFISALAIAAAVSCTKSDIVDTAVDNAIKFENYVGRDAQTKAAIVSGVTSVNVNAWLHEKGAAATGFQADFMTNQAVTKSGDTWTYSPAKYWPNEAQAVSFVGWVPGNNIEVEHATLTFEVPSDVTAQTDLLVANPVLDVNGVSPVALNFKHLLSRIGFQINVSGVDETDTNNIIELTEVVLNGSFASEGTVDMTAATPAVAGTPATTAYQLTGANFGLTNNVLTNGNHANTANSYIMLIPAGNVPTDITVTYTVTTKGATADDDVEITNTAVFPLQQTTEGATAFAYEAGKAYKYIFDITMDAITFSVTETDWDPEVTENITPEDDTTGDDTTEE